MASSLSQTPRRLGTESGRLRRLARQTRREGGNPNSLLAAAAEAKFGERGITSADEAEEVQRLAPEVERTRLAALGRNTFGGSQAPAQGLGGTPAQYDPSNITKLTTPTGTPAAAQSTGTTPPTNVSGVTQTPAAPSRPSKLAGLAEQFRFQNEANKRNAAQDAATESRLAPLEGKQLANSNIAKLGAVGAANDYFARKAQAEAAATAKRTAPVEQGDTFTGGIDATATPTGDDPFADGSGYTPSTQAPESPLARAMRESRERRAGRLRETEEPEEAVVAAEPAAPTSASVAPLVPKASGSTATTSQPPRRVGLLDTRVKMMSQEAARGESIKANRATQATQAQRMAEERRKAPAKKNLSGDTSLFEVGVNRVNRFLQTPLF